MSEQGALSSNTGPYVEWNEYEDKIIVRQSDGMVVLSYSMARELYKSLGFLFGKVSYPEVH